MQSHATTSDKPLQTSGARANELDDRLARAQRERRAIRILLLGAGESGKSTVLKQMRLIHGVNFTSLERSHYAAIIWSDAVQSMRIVLEQAQRLGIELSSAQPGSELSHFRDLILSTSPETVYAEDAEQDRGFMAEYVVDITGGPVQRVEEDERSGLLGTFWNHFFNCAPLRAFVSWGSTPRHPW